MNYRPSQRSTQASRAAKALAAFRTAGVPMVITQNEAFLLTEGQFGTKGDLSTPVNLATVASAITK